MTDLFRLACGITRAAQMKIEVPDYLFEESQERKHENDLCGHCHHPARWHDDLYECKFEDCRCPCYVEPADTTD